MMLTLYVQVKTSWCTAVTVTLPLWLTDDSFNQTALLQNLVEQ